MSVLCWDKPKKVMTEEVRRETYSSDGGVPGTYKPNMSDADRKRWKAKLVGHKSGHPQVEIRKDSFVIIVSLKGGYKYKYYGPGKDMGGDTTNINLHIASAGPIQMTFDQYAEFQQAIEEARESLKKLDDQTSKGKP